MSRMDAKTCMIRTLENDRYRPVLPGEIAAWLTKLNYNKYNPKRERIGSTYDEGWVDIYDDELVQGLLCTYYAEHPELLPEGNDLSFFEEGYGYGWHWIVTYEYLMMLVSTPGSRTLGIWSTSEVRRAACFFLACHWEEYGLSGENYVRAVESLSDFGVKCDAQGEILPEYVEPAQHFLAERECSLRFAFEMGE